MNSHTSPCGHMTLFVAKSSSEWTWIPRRVTGRMTVRRPSQYKSRSAKKFVNYGTKKTPAPPSPVTKKRIQELLLPQARPWHHQVSHRRRGGEEVPPPPPDEPEEVPLPPPAEPGEVPPPPPSKVKTAPPPLRWHYSPWRSCVLLH
jgi:hypothetical protein